MSRICDLKMIIWQQELLTEKHAEFREYIGESLKMEGKKKRARTRTITMDTAVVKSS